MKKNLLCAALGMAALLGTSVSVSAQSGNRWCTTDEHNAELARTFHDPALAAQRATADALAERLQNDDVFARQFYARQAAATPATLGRPAVASRIVPVVVHVITRCGQATLTEAQVQIGLNKVNADFSFTNADAGTTVPVFVPYAANSDIEFRLAKIDPQGNAFSGIHRVSTPATNAVDPRDDIKTIVPSWNGYFNFWIVDAISAGPGSIPGGTILGYAQFPGTGPWSKWGLVMRADDWFTPPPISDGRTATHELGHCFNLYHTFQGGCGSSCAASGDQVCDTPPTVNPTYGCNRSQNTCSNDMSGPSPFTTNVVDQIQNHMSYDNCHTLFTLGQKARMDAAIASFSYIRNLISPANLTRTGVATGQVPAPPVLTPYFTTCQFSLQNNELVACQGRPITLSDASYNTPVTGVSWTFTNATPATSTARNPTVVFNTPGLQTVTLTPSSAAGPATPLTITVRVLPAGLVAPVTEGFEGGNQITDNLWRVESSALTGTTRWKLVGFTGNQVTTEGDTAVRVQMGSVAGGTVNTLYSPAFDTRNLAGSNPAPSFAFDMSYAKRVAASADELKVSFSTDCGRTWLQRRTYTTTLPTVTTLQANFTPTALTQWRTENITLTAQYLNQASVMFRFEATSAASGNNLYLDNIRLNGRPLGVAAELAAAGIGLAPNPLTAETGLHFSLTRATRVAVRVLDVLGRPVLTDAARTLAPGDHELPLAARLQAAAPGVYVVLLELDGRAYSQKLLIQ